MTAWDDYLAAAQRLDAVRRVAAAVVAEQTKSLQAAREELATVRTRLSLQRSRLLDAARQAGLPPPDLTPAKADLPAATPQAVRPHLAVARNDLDHADGVLSGVGERPAGPPVLRNACVYGGYALLAALLEVLAFLGADERSAAALLVLGCGVVLPVFVFAFGWLTTGALDPPARTPGLGVLMSLLSLLPPLAMAVWVSTI